MLYTTIGAYFYAKIKSNPKILEFTYIALKKWKYNIVKKIEKKNYTYMLIYLLKFLLWSSLLKYFKSKKNYVVIINKISYKMLKP